MQLKIDYLGKVGEKRAAAIIKNKDIRPDLTQNPERRPDGKMVMRGPASWEECHEVLKELENHASSAVALNAGQVPVQTAPDPRSATAVFQSLG